VSDEVQVGRVSKGPDGNRYWVKEPEPIHFDLPSMHAGPPTDPLAWYTLFGQSLIKPQHLSLVTGI
jgi:hypothetical protein